MEGKPRPCLILVRYISLERPAPHGPADSVVKCSRWEHALPDAGSVQMATAQHYRDYDGEGPGTKDEQEATYVKSLLSHLEKRGPEAAARFQLRNGHVSGSVTYQVDSQWLYCTSLHPRSAIERASLLSEFDADCMTDLGDPSTLARELGSAVGQMTPTPAVVLDGFHQLQLGTLRTQSASDRIVRVCHGPVVYTDDAERLIEAVPLLHRASAVPFVKRLTFAPQREYRFTVSTIGTPAYGALLVPATPKLALRK